METVYLVWSNDGRGEFKLLAIYADRDRAEQYASALKHSEGGRSRDYFVEGMHVD